MSPKQALVFILFFSAMLAVIIALEVEIDDLHQHIKTLILTCPER